MTLCGMEYVNLKTNTNKILGIHFSYAKELKKMYHKNWKIIELVENA